jgi:hypothetical protein
VDTIGNPADSSLQIEKPGKMVEVMGPYPVPGAWPQSPAPRSTQVVPASQLREELSQKQEEVHHIKNTAIR